MFIYLRNIPKGICFNNFLLIFCKIFTTIQLSAKNHKTIFKPLGFLLIKLWRIIKINFSFTRIFNIKEIIRRSIFKCRKQFRCYSTWLTCKCLSCVIKWFTSLFQIFRIRLIWIWWHRLEFRLNIISCCRMWRNALSYTNYWWPFGAHHCFRIFLISWVLFFDYIRMKSLFLRLNCIFNFSHIF